jgi:alpha-tubulin suppressor-like RCC1 family protein
VFAYTLELHIETNLTAKTASVLSIAVGFAHTCAVFTNKQVKCWGSNHNGQLGVRDRSDRKMPASVTFTSRQGDFTLPQVSNFYIPCPLAILACTALNIHF